MSEEQEEYRGRKEVAKVEIHALDNFSNFEEMESFAEKIIKSGMVPEALNSPAKLIAVIQMGRELGFKAMTSINGIHNIKNRPTLSVHLWGTRLRMLGIHSQTVEDYVVEYTTTSVQEGDQVVEKQIPTDAKTTIEFMRKTPFGIIKEQYTLRWSDAKIAGWTDKNTWKTMPKIMLWNRCYVLGARRIAPDAVQGIYETTEILDSVNADYTIDDEGSVTSIN